MKNGVVGRADLLDAYLAGGPELQAVVARLLGMELVEGRVIGTCEFCQQRADYTPPEDDGPVVAWCSTPGCQCWSTFAYDQNREDEPADDDPNLICQFCSEGMAAAATGPA